MPLPPRGRLPIPYPAACLFAVVFLDAGKVQAAIALMLAVERYMGPSEAFSLRARDVMPGAEG
eukprot:6281817-Lingulodinium_polyedra.AAC.1